MNVNVRSFSRLSLLFLIALPAQTQRTQSANLNQGYGQLPAIFEANQGQTDSQVKFLSRGGGHMLFLTPTEAVLALNHASLEKHEAQSTEKPVKSGRSVLRMRLIGSNPAPHVEGVGELPGRTNYIIGNDPKNWLTNIKNYEKVRYREVYPGINVIYHSNGGELEYDFVVAPASDPSQIRFELRGADSVRMDKRGDLVVVVNASEVRWHKPVLYQVLGGANKKVAGDYVVKDKNHVAFNVAKYDKRKSLVIDPVLSYSSYLGGNGYENGWGVAVDPAGYAYVAGITLSSDFPTTPGSFQPIYGGTGDAFVTKVDPSGSTLLYSTYLGGSSGDGARALALGSDGSAYLAGQTQSTDFPTTPGSFQPAFGGGQDAFVARLSPDGSRLVYSTYLGGRRNDFAYGIFVDSAGDAYVTGGTDSFDSFPTTPGAFQRTCIGPRGCVPAFVSKLNATGSTLLFSSLLGGIQPDGNCFTSGLGISADSSGHAYVTGSSNCTDFPTTPDAFQTVLNRGTCDTPIQQFRCFDAFVTKFDPFGSSLIYSTYLGGSGNDGGNAIAIDSFGNAYVTGFTGSSNFPTVSPIQETFGGGTCGTPPDTFPCFDVFVSKLDSLGSTLVYSTYLGGSDTDHGNAITLEPEGGVYVTGLTRSVDFPTANALQNDLGGGICGTFACPDAFVAHLSPPGDSLLFSTYLGGTGEDFGGGIALDDSGNIYLTGSTTGDFPTTKPFQPEYGGGPYDAFIVKITRYEPPCVAPFALRSRICR